MIFFFIILSIFLVLKLHVFDVSQWRHFIVSKGIAALSLDFSKKKYIFIRSVLLFFFFFLILFFAEEIKKIKLWYNWFKAPWFKIALMKHLFCFRWGVYHSCTSSSKELTFRHAAIFLLKNYLYIFRVFYFFYFFSRNLDN